MESVDECLLASKDYVDRVLRESRLALLSATQPKKKPAKPGKAVSAVPDTPPVPPKEGRIYIASSFPDWQEAAMAVLKEAYEVGSAMV